MRSGGGPDWDRPAVGVGPSRGGPTTVAPRRSDMDLDGGSPLPAAKPVQGAATLGMTLYVGGSARTVNGRPMLLTGRRMFNPAKPPRQRRHPGDNYLPPAERFTAAHTGDLDGDADSGA